MKDSKARLFPTVMVAARLGSIVAVLMLTISGLVGANDDVDPEILFRGNSDMDGPFWIEFSCELDTCQDMELSLIHI